MIGERQQINYNNVHSEITEGETRRSDPHFFECLRMISRVYIRINEFLDNFMKRLEICDGKLQNIHEDLESFRSYDWMTMKDIRENGFRGMGGTPGTKYAYIPVPNSRYEFPNKAGLENLTSIEQIKGLSKEKINQYLDFYSIFPNSSFENNKRALIKYIGVSQEYH